MRIYLRGSLCLLSLLFNNLLKRSLVTSLGLGLAIYYVLCVAIDILFAVIV